MGARWKEYVKQGKWIYEDHAFWISGYTFWALKEEGEYTSFISSREGESGLLTARAHSP